MSVCNVCFRKCDIKDGDRGFCGVRICADDRVVPTGYGRVTSLALDPIEKKPLNRFMPGSRILSVGSYGCNLRCPFCQNSEISWSEQAYRYETEAEILTPEELADIAVSAKTKGNIGLAYTYNEPLTDYEFVRDTGRLIHEAGMVNVLVTNGCASLEILRELTPVIDAMNIDLKGFTREYYTDVLKGDLDMVLEFIKEAVKVCHVELTTLIVPGYNDSEEEIRNIAEFIAGLKDKDGNKTGVSIPLHISRFFPQYMMTDRPPTDVDHIYHLKETASEKLRYVYTGNC